MADVTYNAVYKKNTGAVLSPVELRELYLYGINLKSRDGTEVPQYVWEQKIKSAQEKVEKFLAIKFARQLYTEKCTYFQDDYINNLPIIPTSLPVFKTIRLLGILSGTEQIKYPTEWINQYECSDENATRRINIVPSGAATGAATNVILMGVMAQLGIRSLREVPNYWNCSYLTGFSPSKLPMELLDIVGKLAAIAIMAIYGDLVLPPGLSGQSLSIDGLSQSIQTPVNARGGAFSGRIAQYTEEIKDSLEKLTMNYKGLNFSVL